MIANCQAGNILLIAHSFSCDSFDCELWKNSQFAMKESRNQNPTYGIRSSVRMCAHIYICACIRVSLCLFTRKNANAVSYVHMREFACVCLRACLCAALIKTQSAFACKIFQHSNTLWVQKLSGCTIYRTDTLGLRRVAYYSTNYPDQIFQRCPDIIDLFQGVRIREVSLFQGVLIREVSLFQGVLIREVSLFQGVLIREVSYFRVS